MADLRPGEADTHPSPMLVFNGTLFFRDYSYGNDRGALWRTDGSTEGTQGVRAFGGGDIVSGLVVLGGTLVLVVEGGISKTSLWRSDGTTQGTVKFYDFGWYRYVWAMEVVGDLLFLQVYNSWSHDSALWRSDGTPEGTFSLADTVLRWPPPIPLGDQFLFVKEAAENRGELWITDGTQVTLLLAAFEPGPRDWDMFEFLPVGDEVWFTADDG
ncbi:MAG: hypothetical protein GY835_18320, partial [bacterium]|nr:hypothetical protein [bacterium]